MIPQQRLSTQLVDGDFRQGLIRDIPFIDYELAGVGLNDPSLGLQYQIWTLEYIKSTGDFVLSASNFPPTVQFNRPNVSYISLSFDTNMNPFISFVENGISKFWWFNTLTGLQEFAETLIATAQSPYASLDDTRPLQNQNTDIILSYIRAGNLYFRAQRDRYLVEYLLASGVTGQVLVAGMATNFRYKFILGTFQ